jgi:hypothetical protein
VLLNGFTYGEGVVLYASNGDLTNSGRIDASGGTGNYGGGDSGTVILEAPYGDLVNSADILASGGGATRTSYSYGGDCTEVYFPGLDMDITVALWGATISSSGSISANGGNGSDMEGTGSGGVIVLYAPGAVSCSALSANGGSMSVACIEAGNGGEIYVAGGVVTASGLSARGGNTPDGTGGDGGYIEVASSAAASSVGSTDVNGGAGSPDNGGLGDVWIDGVHVIGGIPLP